MAYLIKFLTSLFQKPARVLPGTTVICEPGEYERMVSGQRTDGQW